MSPYEGLASINSRSGGAKDSRASLGYLEYREILKEGLKGLPARVEIYGRDYVYNVDYVAERMKELIKEYRRN